MGQFCPLRTEVPSFCPDGTYGAAMGLKTSECSGLCPAGFFCPAFTIQPLPCGNVAVYCPQGSAAPKAVQPGYFSDLDVGVDPAGVNGSLSVMARQVECPPGLVTGIGATLLPCISVVRG